MAHKIRHDVLDEQDKVYNGPQDILFNENLTIVKKIA